MTTANMPKPAIPLATPSPVPPTGKTFAPIDPVRVLRQHVVTLIVVTIIGAAIGVGLWLVLRKFAPRYESVMLLEIQDIPGTGTETPQEAARNATGNLEQIEAQKATEIARLRSDTVLYSVLTWPDIQQTLWMKRFSLGVDPQTQQERFDLTKARKSLEDMLGTYPSKGSTYFQVSIRCRYRSEAQRILDAVVRRYLDEVEAIGTNMSAGVRRALVDERDEVDRRLKRVQEEIQKFTTSQDVDAMDVQLSSVTVQYKALAERLSELEAGANAARSSYEQLRRAQAEGQILYEPEAVASVKMDPTVRDREERIRLLRERRGVLASRFGDSHRMVADVENMLVEAKRELDQQMDKLLRQYQAVQMEQAQKTASALQEQFDKSQGEFKRLRAEMMDLGAKIEHFNQLKEREATERENLRTMETSLANMRLIAARPDKATVAKMGTASEPKLVAPRPSVIIPASTILVLGGITALIFLLEIVDQRIKSPSDLAVVQRARLLGIVPDTSEDPSAPAGIDDVVRRSPAGLMAESFRQLRTAMTREIAQMGHKTLSFTCARAGAGVTAVCSNLAASLAAQGKRVLMIDANFSRPALHETFKVASHPGLVEVLMGNCSWERAVVDIAGHGLFLLPAGKTSAAYPELLERPAFADLLTKAAERYDAIFIDTPPVFVASEAKLVAQRVDAVLVVAQATVDKRGMIGRLLRELEGSRARVLGVVLNRARASAGGYFRENFEAFYRYRSNTTSLVPPVTAKSPSPA